MDFYLASFPLEGQYSWMVTALIPEGAGYEELCTIGPNSFIKDAYPTDTPTPTATQEDDVIEEPVPNPDDPPPEPDA